MPPFSKDDAQPTRLEDESARYSSKLHLLDLVDDCDAVVVMLLLSDLTMITAWRGQDDVEEFT